MKLNRRKLFFAAIAFLILGLIALVLLTGNWLIGGECLYDVGGFSKLSDGEVIALDDGRTVRCERGKLIFE